MKREGEREEAQTSRFHPDRLHWTLSFVIGGLIALCFLLYFRGRPAADAQAASATERPPAPVALRESVATHPVPAPPVRGEGAPVFQGNPARPGRVLGRVAFPTAGRNHRVFSYQIYVFSAEGTLDGPRPFANSDRFELTNLPPGRKAVFFFSPTEFLTCPYQIATVPEGGESQVVLAPSACHILEGKVVDANGTAMGGVYVTACETVSLPQELYLEGKPSAIADLETTVNSAGVTTSIGSNPAEIPALVLKVQPGEGRILRSAMTDARGKFLMPVSSVDIPISLTVSSGPGEILKEELVIPSSGPARIILPNR